MGHRRQSRQMKKRKVQGAILLLMLTLGFLVTMIWTASTVKRVVTTGVDPAWVEQAVQAVQLTKAERVYEEILFSDNILDTVALAKEGGRPILMFSNDGPLGRC